VSIIIMSSIIAFQPKLIPMFFYAPQTP
jgi:hypothetical protein